MTTSSSIAPFSTPSPASFGFCFDVVVTPEGKPIPPYYHEPGCLQREFLDVRQQDILETPQTEIRSASSPLLHTCLAWLLSQQGMIDERRNINFLDNPAFITFPLG